VPPEGQDLGGLIIAIPIPLIFIAHLPKASPVSRVGAAHFDLSFFSFRVPLVPRSRQASSSLLLDSGSSSPGWNFFSDRPPWSGILACNIRQPEPPFAHKYPDSSFVNPRHLPSRRCCCWPSAAAIPHILLLTRSTIRLTHTSPPSPHAYHSICTTDTSLYKNLIIIHFCRQQFTQVP
jgi:hypothetical protein